MIVQQFIDNHAKDFILPTPLIPSFPLYLLFLGINPFSKLTIRELVQLTNGDHFQLKREHTEGIIKRSHLELIKF